MNKIKILSGIALATLFVGCGDESVTNSLKEAKENGNVSILMKEATTALPIDSVTIVDEKNDKAILTDSAGYATWKDLNIGTYVFTASKDGYATIQFAVALADDGTGDVPRVADMVEKIDLPQLGVTVSGTILYDDPDNTVTAAESVMVALTYDPESNLNYTIIPAEITTITNAKGVYKFSNLPAGVSFGISTLPATIKSRNYASASTSVSALRIDGSTSAEILTIEPVQAQFKLISSNVSDIDTSTSVKLNFSAPIDSTELSSTNISVTNNNTIVLISYTLSSDLKTLTVKPVSGKWSDGDTYSLSYTLTSTDGVSLSGNVYFPIGGINSSIPGQVSSLAVGYDDTTSTYYTYFVLKWKAAVSGATGYYVYYKTDLDADYTRATVSSSTTTSARVSTDYLSIPTSASKIYFIVLPYNENGTADASKAKAVTYTLSTT